MSAKSNDKEWKKLCAQGKLKPSKIKKKSKHLVKIPNWESKKLDIMRGCLIAKFSQEPLRTQLIETGNEHLQEGNTWGDTFWGVDLETGNGANHLGKLIMDIRTEFISNNATK